MSQQQQIVSGTTYELNEKASDNIRQMVVPGEHYVVEGLWKELTGKSWLDSDGNPAAIQYALRVSSSGLPWDDDVYYGRINNLGHLVHASEIGPEAS